jgi:hypothetical protein
VSDRHPVDRHLEDVVPALRQSRPPLAKAQPRSESGLHAAAEQISSDLAAFAPTRASVGPRKALRRAANVPSLARFKAAVDRLKKVGHSWQDIGDYLGRCSKQNVMSVYDGHTMVQGYMLDLFDVHPDLIGEEEMPAKMRATQLTRKAG